MGNERKAAVPGTVGAVVGLCETCRWWAPEDWTADTNARQCECPKNTQDYNTFPDDDGAGDVDTGGIWTGPKFGCVHYQTNAEHQRRAVARPSVCSCSPGGQDAG